MSIEADVYCEKIVDDINSYVMDPTAASVLADYLNSVKMASVENLYNRLFNDIMKQSRKYFLLPEKASKVLAIHFVELIITSRNKKEIVDEITTKILTEKEIAGLQYLGGYVLRKLFMTLKTTKSDSKCSQQAIDILLTAKSTNEDRPTETYVDKLSRGGLWVITQDMEKVFVLAEKYFCVQTATKGLRKIDTEKLVDNLINFPPLALTFNHIVSDSNTCIDKEIEVSTLSSILTLYLRVRSFSSAKDLVALSKRKLDGGKSLRKSIKQASKNEDTK